MIIVIKYLPWIYTDLDKSRGIFSDYKSVELCNSVEDFIHCIFCISTILSSHPSSGIPSMSMSGHRHLFQLITKTQTAKDIPVSTVIS